jgi:hypothetical protein
MSFFNPTLRQQKERLVKQAELTRLKAGRCTNLRQRTALLYKADLKLNQANSLWRKLLFEGK